MIEELFNKLKEGAYDAEYHNYHYKEANQIIRAFFERCVLPQIKNRDIMDKEIRNVIATPSKKGARIMRVVAKDLNYYDVIIVRGTSMETRMGLAKYAHVLSGYYKRTEAPQEVDVDYIMLGCAKNGRFSAPGKGEGIIAHTMWLNDERTEFCRFNVDRDSLVLIEESEEIINIEKFDND